MIYNIPLFWDYGMDDQPASPQDIKLKPDLANFTFEGREVICAMPWTSSPLFGWENPTVW